MKKILLLTFLLMAVVILKANKVLNILGEKSFPIAELGAEIPMTDFTCEAWINIDPVAVIEMDPDDPSKPRINSFTPIFDTRPLTGGNAEGCVLRVDAAGSLGLGFEWNNNWTYAADYELATKFPGIVAGVWIHVAWTLDGVAGKLTVYINGVEVDNVTVDGYKGPAPFGDLLAIGGNLRIPDRTFIGKMDEIRLWNVARSAAEISANYKKTVDPAETGLLAYYQCEDVFADLVLADATSNKFDAKFLSTNTGGSTPWEAIDNFDFIEESIPGFGGTSVENTKNQSVKFFPNPVTDKIQVQGVDLTKAQINIYTLSGQLVSSPVSNSSVIDVANLKSGFYIVKIENGSERINFKIIK